MLVASHRPHSILPQLSARRPRPGRQASMCSGHRAGGRGCWDLSPAWASLLPSVAFDYCPLRGRA